MVIFVFYFVSFFILNFCSEKLLINYRENNILILGETMNVSWSHTISHMVGIQKTTHPFPAQRISRKWVKIYFVINQNVFKLLRKQLYSNILQPWLRRQHKT